MNTPTLCDEIYGIVSKNIEISTQYGDLKSVLHDQTIANCNMQMSCFEVISPNRFS